MSEFADRPFAAGSLTGVRSFRVTPDGMLTGVVHRGVWRPGVNEAACTRDGGISALPKPPPARPAMPDHQAGTLDCTCGFYAYFDDGHNPHHEPGNVLGIVEGFGVCTVGSRGFRSSKARIRALIFTEEQAVHARYPDVPIFPTLDAALAEYPLTPVESPEPKVIITHVGVVLAAGTYTVNVDLAAVTNALSRAYRNLAKDMKTPSAPTDETPQARALRLRRSRNTGPSDRLGLDGHLRRRTR